jgi:biotin carboxylase
MPRVLLLATTTGYQTRAFGEAAGRLGVELVFATDRCSVLEDPWQDEALAIRFYDEAASVETIVAHAKVRPIHGVVAVGDRPTGIAARAARALGLKGHPHDAVVTARHKLLTRQRLRDAGLTVPWFRHAAVSDPPATLGSIPFPAVVKPVALSGSRGVMRVDDEAGLAAAWARLAGILRSPDVQSERTDLHDTIVVEGFVEGREFALEGLMTDGTLQTLAIFDKPDPLEGPFFEETIYLTPSSQPAAVQRDIARDVARAAAAIGLHHGPIHAECRVNAGGVVVLEVAARPIGGLCARALRFGAGAPLEELLLRHALGEEVGHWTRERPASGVMMIPIPRRGVFRGVAGVEAARAVPGIDDVRVTAKPDQLLVPLPEGSSYLGFLFARADTPAKVDAALRAAHARLEFAVDPEVRVLQSVHG